ncbi:MAG: hypothetical protein EZS28_025170, partial [Streblomastix strix]
MAEHLLNQSEQIGGQIVAIEVNDALFGRRKN